MPPRLTRLRFVPAHACAVLAACTLLVTAPPGNAETPPGDLPYVSGGIGEEELAVLRLVRGDYNLRLLFADQSGTYLSGIEARILNAHGKTVLTVKDAGPFLYVRLPAGHYRIEARYAERTQRQDIELAATTTGRDKIFRW